ncbi:MAG TPA: SpoIIE family protein phosphatase [Anaerolineae bacterium]|nr:SpoIIE family protein phosphatase [Anaerolineae bacterium]
MTVTDNQHRLYLQREITAVTELTPWLQQVMDQLALSDDLRFRLDLVVMEAVNNVIQHRVAGDSADMMVEVVGHTDGVWARLTYQGADFNPWLDYEVALPQTLDMALAGGFGIHLMRTYTNGRFYRRDDQGKNQMVLVLVEEGVASDVLDRLLLRHHRLFWQGADEVTIMGAVEEMLATCEVVNLVQGEVLLAEGVENHEMYLLLQGRVEIHLEGEEAPAAFLLEAGQSVGEMSIIEGRRTSAAVVASEMSRLVVVPELYFWEKVMGVSWLAKNMVSILSSRMRRFSDKMQKALRQELAYVHWQKELQAAARIQTDILPHRPPFFPRHPEVEVATLMLPAKDVGGDFYDVIVLDETHVCVAVGDVSGKGLPAALFMMKALTLLRVSMQNPTTFGTVLSQVNRLLCVNNDEMNFTTLVVMMLDVKRGRLTYLSGGHWAPLLRRRGEGCQFLPVPEGALLGITPEVRYGVATVQLAVGDLVLLYTDGVTECENGKGQVWGENGLRRVVDGLGIGVTSEEVVAGVKGAVQAFAGAEGIDDDVTMVALRYLGVHDHYKG